MIIPYHATQSLVVQNEVGDIRDNWLIAYEAKEIFKTYMTKITHWKGKLCALQDRNMTST